MHGRLPRCLDEGFRKLAQQKESEVDEGRLMPDPVRMMISIPPRHVVSRLGGCIKGKGAIHLARACGERKRNFVGQHVRASGDVVSTVGRNEQVICECIRSPQDENERSASSRFWR
jgi:putative transposase